MQGRKLADRYCLIEKLGQGAMGSVWRAEHLTLRTKVAVKLIDPGIAESPGALARFQREALSAAELRSAHIVHVMDYGVDDGTPFIVMELLEGENLATRLARVIRLAPEEAKQVLLQVCRALTVAHGKGIIHRDLKPDNIFITREGDDDVAKVLDFGVAKRLDALSTSSDLRTRSGMLLGTPYYMSPEQAMGEVTIDQRADIWSLGIIAYECMTGQRPYNKDTLGALLMSICQDSPPVPSSVAVVPQGFDEWFARATARDPGARFQTAAEAANALKSLGSAVTSSILLSESVPAKVVSASLDTGTRRIAAAESFVPSAVTAATALPSIRMRRLALFAVPLLGLLTGSGYWALSKSARVRSTEATTVSAMPTLAASALAANPAAVTVIATQLPSATGVAASVEGAEVSEKQGDVGNEQRANVEVAPVPLPTAPSVVPQQPGQTPATAAHKPPPANPANGRPSRQVNHAGF